MVKWLHVYDLGVNYVELLSNATCVVFVAAASYQLFTHLNHGVHPRHDRRIAQLRPLCQSLDTRKGVATYT